MALYRERDPRFDFRADSKTPPNKAPSTKGDWFELHRLKQQEKKKNEAGPSRRAESDHFQHHAMLQANRRRRDRKNMKPEQLLAAMPDHHKMSDLYKRYVTNTSRSDDMKRANQKIKKKLRKRLRNGRRKMFNETTATPTAPALRTGMETKGEAGAKKLSPYSLSPFLESLSNTFKYANITQEVIGKTASYNDLILLRISEAKSEVSKYFRADEGKYMEESSNKKIVFIVHGLSAMGFNQLPCLSEVEKFKQLLKYYFEHLDKFDIYLIPMANPDGVTMNDPLWNKNTSPQHACSGVALDRNFDVAWNETRKISSCSQQFPGPYPFSETETKAIREVFHRFSQNIVAYFHVHAGTFSADVFKGDAVLYPKGYSENESDDDKYMDLRGELEEVMKNASFQIISVTVDTMYNWYYGKVTGSSVDYASSVYGIPYAMELVMQLYTNDAHAVSSAEKETNAALEEIWKRLINVIFKNIHRNSN